MWKVDVISAGAFIEFSGLLFITYVAMARKSRGKALARLDDQGFDLSALAATQPLTPTENGYRLAEPEAPVGPAPRAPLPLQAASPSDDAPPPSAPWSEDAIEDLEKLAQQKGEGAIPALAKALRSSDPRLAETAANLLGEIGGSQALQALLAVDTPSNSKEGLEQLEAIASRSDPNPAQAGWVQSTMEEAFQTPFQNPIPTTKPEVEESPSSLPAMRLFEPLSRNDFRALHRYCPHDPRELDEGELAAVLLRLTENRSEKAALRYFATKNLVRFRHRDIQETLLDLLSDPLPLVRYAAADALAVHGDMETVPFLVEALGDPEGSVRASAAHTLAVLGDDIAIRPLLDLREDEDEVVRYAARRALEAIGRRKKISALIRQAS